MINKCYIKYVTFIYHFEYSQYCTNKLEMAITANKMIIFWYC